MDEIKEVEVGLITVNSFNPNEISIDKLAALKLSMAKDGQQQPVILRVGNIVATLR